MRACRRTRRGCLRRSEQASMHSTQACAASMQHAHRPFAFFEASKQHTHKPFTPSLFPSHHALSPPLSLPITRNTQIEREMELFEKEERWQASNVIHGDPVFSNVLLTDDGRIFLLDMRGEQGNILTLQGDLTYDLSKVYQVSIVARHTL